uniref:Uncharacterized protein n=1 Tax=Siphoviridae sp. ctLKg7 TaxID=2825452 RepID=A0A8S5UVR0_9CAUD|nr:MAG TPA: hypothetical protein [Siphoviridae sp. ctLKg7]DAI30716.1 MAG TPA: hypothetical protein [Caudoviricetes sp.]
MIISVPARILRRSSPVSRSLLRPRRRCSRR